MTYPSQPGYPTPQYGGQSPQPPQQNNLWLIGGAVLTVLIIIMTVILLVVQRTQSTDSSDGGTDPETGTDTSEDEGGGDEGNDNGGDDGGTDLQATELTSEACDAFDTAAFEEAFGALDPDQTSRTESSSNGLASLSCSFYNEEYTGVNLRISDYEDVDDVVSWVESDADYYNAENGYEYSEYTKYGDAGSLYMDDDATKTITIHVALGSLDVSVYTTLWEGEGLDEAAATAALEDIIAQCDQLFVDYQ